MNFSNRMGKCCRDSAWCLSSWGTGTGTRRCFSHDTGQTHRETVLLGYGGRHQALSLQSHIVFRYNRKKPFPRQGRERAEIARGTTLFQSIEKLILVPYFNGYTRETLLKADFRLPGDLQRSAPRKICSLRDLPSLAEYRCLLLLLIVTAMCSFVC